MGPTFSHERENTDCQLLSLDRGSTVHQRYEGKQQAIYINFIFFHASSFHLSKCAFVCVHKETKQGLQLLLLSTG